MGLIPTICEEVPAPRVLNDSRRMATLARELAECGYKLANCAARLGVFPRLGVNFWPALRRPWTADPGDTVDTLLELLIDGCPVPVDRLRKHVSASLVRTLVETGLTQEMGMALQSNLCLFPCYGKYIVTDRAMKNSAINQVMWLWGESFLLAGMVPRKPRRRAIDLGTGSGVHALLASDHCQSVVGVDINPRALEFARFNAALNGVTNVDFLLSDIFGGVDSALGSTSEAKFDLLVANPPYLPDGAAQAGDNFWSGGAAGSEILARIVAALPSRLEADGTAHLVALFPFSPGAGMPEHFDTWLAGTLAQYDVLDHTWAVPNFQDVLSAEPFAGDKSAWRFGVVSLRRTGSDRGWWKHVAGNTMFFREDGGAAAVADHGEF